MNRSGYTQTRRRTPDRLWRSARRGGLALCIAALSIAAPIPAADGPVSEYSRGGVRDGRSVREPNRTMRETSAGTMKSRPVHEYGGATMRSGSVSEITAGPGRDRGQLSGSGSIGQASAGAVTARQPPPGPVSDDDLDALQERMRALMLAPVPDEALEPQTEVEPTAGEEAGNEGTLREPGEPFDETAADDELSEPEIPEDEQPLAADETASGAGVEAEAAPPPAQEP